MKTAISMDDALMSQADEAARQLGLSRSALIAEAVRAYLRSRAQARTTAQLNQAYADEPDAGERRLVRSLRSKVHPKESW